MRSLHCSHRSVAHLVLAIHALFLYAGAEYERAPFMHALDSTGVVVYFWIRFRAIGLGGSPCLTELFSQRISCCILHI